MENDYLIWITLGTTGLIFWIGGLYFEKYPPQKINWWYGYRTKRSMRNLEVWTFAQAYAAKAMQKMGLRILLMGGVLGFFNFGGAVRLTIILLITAIYPFWMIFSIEKVLKQKFPDQ